MAFVIDFKGNWDEYLPLIEFAFNNSYHWSIAMAPFETLYGRWCRSPIVLFEVDEFAIVGLESIYEVVEKVWLIKDNLKMSQSRQKSYINNRKRDLDFMVGDLVYLKITFMKRVMRFGRKGNLVPIMWGQMRLWNALRMLPNSWNHQLNWLRCIRWSMCQFLKSA